MASKRQQAKETGEQNEKKKSNASTEPPATHAASSADVDETAKPVAVAKPVEWIKAAKNDLLAMPPQVRLGLSQTLKAVQYGEMPDDVSPFEGSTANNVLKIRENYDKDTYRLVFAAKFEKAIYVLHAFKKKSNQGIATPKKDIELVYERFKQAEAHYKLKYESENKKEENTSK